MPQRYERVSAQEDSTSTSFGNEESRYDGGDRAVPSSPPPSFRSRASSIAPHQRTSIDTTTDRERLISSADRELADTFDSPSDGESDAGGEHQLDDRQRVMSGRPEAEAATGAATLGSQPAVERRALQLPIFAPNTSTTARRTYGGGAQDGVFANLSAKPERGEDLEEKPPTYEQAAADATPPYWETTILAPGGAHSDEVYIDGLPVGSLFSFVWNGMISMSFQLVGFLLTYLLHTTHAAKHGSKAGLGITLVQYGFSMLTASTAPATDPAGDRGPGFAAPPSDPNSHDFDPDALAAPPPPDASGPAGGVVAGAGGLATSNTLAYILMVVGWFVLIRAVGEYLKARRHEQLVTQSPARGLNAPVVAEGETAETTA